MDDVSEWLGGEARSEIVIAPAHPFGPGGFELEARPMPEGGSVQPVFSTVALLVEQLGRYQPWVALPLAKVRELSAGAGVSSVVLDPRIAAGGWEWSQEDIRNFNESRSSGE